MSGRLKTAMLLSTVVAAALTMSLAAAGCGGGDDDSSDEPVVTQETVKAAEKSAGRSALVSAERVQDRYLPGRIEMRAACTTPVPPPPPDTPYQLRCLVEGFGTPPGKDVLSYMTSEEWLVPVDATGRVGEATILGQARIRAYRRRDDRLNCTNREVRADRCAPPLPGQVVATPPAALPQGENVPGQPVPLNP